LDEEDPLELDELDPPAGALEDDELAAAGAVLSDFLLSLLDDDPSDFDSPFFGDDE
jgi:hypothetical protein